ncbi:hypothetical protein FOMA001_g13359 [Fusarium oxysporum f. sp. matthiolae]|jgi:hypothetical protein|nr:hypothetical protein FOMA001_g13359 [Fusarium oxysporum f. sp. matthiolae]
MSFDPIRCAELHNQLLSKVTSHILGAAQLVRRDIISRMEEAASMWPNGIHISPETPLYHFLSLLDSYEPDELPLTAEFRQPMPQWFDNPFNEYGDHEVILLYPDNLDQPPMDGGLYFSLALNLVSWGRTDYCLLPPDNEWIPLELALSKACYMWECGKSYWHNNTVSLRNWTPLDVEEALGEWDRLLAAIQNRLPLSKGASRPHFQDPLPADLVQSVEISSFARAFLTAAKRPPFIHVAPGITTFTPESFMSLYGSEPNNAPRRVFELDPEEEISSLLFPATATPIPKAVRPSGNYSFLADSFNADFTVSRCAGLYTQPTTCRMDADEVWLVTAQGIENPVRFEGRRPWGAPRGMRLMEMLALWGDMVENGCWDISIEGVSTPHVWFTNPETENDRRMLWTEWAR